MVVGELKLLNSWVRHSLWRISKTLGPASASLSGFLLRLHYAYASSLITSKHTTNSTFFILGRMFPLKPFLTCKWPARACCRCGREADRLTSSGLTQSGAEAAERQRSSSSGNSIPSGKRHLTILPPKARCFLTEHPPQITVGTPARAPTAPCFYEEIAQKISI